MIQSSFRSYTEWTLPNPFGDPIKIRSPGIGNFEVVARIGDKLAQFWREDKAPFDWHGPFFIQGSGFTGNPSFVQSTFGSPTNNFELVIPLQTGGFASYWRDNNAEGLPWNGPFQITPEGERENRRNLSDSKQLWISRSTRSYCN